MQADREGWELSAEAYASLREVAAACLRGERPDHTHQPTSLAHEAYMRLRRFGGVPGDDELASHAARVMRQVLVDHARKRRARKRSVGGQRVSLRACEVISDGVRQPVDCWDVDGALRHLEALDPDLALVVELRYFGGLSEPETARVLGASVSTVSRRWRIARMFLARELRDGAAGDGNGSSL
jgi:RNA polymerase sigma factor (TIGR02999 family)